MPFGANTALTTLDVAFEPVDVPSLGTVFQTAFIIALPVFGLPDQLSGGIVAVGGDFAVPADQYEIVKEPDDSDDLKEDSEVV